jgi:hypothetical protein
MSDTTFSLDQFEASDTAVLTVRNAADDDDLIGADGANPVTIEMYGPGSEQYAKAQAKIEAAAQSRMFAAARGKVSKDSPAETRKINAEKFAACTKTISNFPVDPMALYSNPKLGYITNQAAKFIETWGNFKPASTTS